MFFASLQSFALEAPPLRYPTNDYAKILSSKTENELNLFLQQLKESTETQLAILTIPTLEEETVESFSIKVVDSWKLGKDKSDKGILFLIAMKEKRLRIEVGQGLEGDLPDAYAKRILDEIKPIMKTGDFDNAVKLAVVRILERTNPDFLAQNDSNQITQTQTAKNLPAESVFFLLIILFLVVSKIFFPRRTRSLGLVEGILIGSLGGGKHRGGGFGGFGGGGGGFSGGGASGDW